MSAWLMSVFYQGMTKNEIVDLTLAMAKSGDMLDLSSIHGIKVDKHSTGGVGDKTTFIVAPVLAALGVPMAKMSGRGLGHTGGTIDKLESIPGFSVAISEQEFIGNVNKNKLSIVGQTGNLAPADKKIYALRDVTATVDSIPLIASSIMSKKLAAGADVIVLDIKCGSGAFMKTIEEAKELAKTMVDIGNMAGKKTYGIITDMNEPLGCKVGNALEVKEAIEVLKINNIEDALTGKSDINHGIRKLIKVSLCLAAYMLIGAEKADDYETAYNKCVNAIESGQALKKFAEFVKSQGGDDSVIYNTKLLPEAKYCVPVYFSGEGYISYCKTSEIGMVSLILGGGRAVKEDKIDLAVGIDIRKHLGEYVSSKEPFAYIHANNMEVVDEAVKRLVGAYNITDTQEEFCDIIKDIILPNNK